METVIFACFYINYFYRKRFNIYKIVKDLSLKQRQIRIVLRRALHSSLPTFSRCEHPII